MKQKIRGLIIISMLMLVGFYGKDNLDNTIDRVNEPVMKLETESSQGYQLRDTKPEEAEEEVVEGTIDKSTKEDAEDIQLSKQETLPKEKIQELEIPSLAMEGKTVEDFLPQGWKLMDSITLDFNRDGYQDVVGVLEVEMVEDMPFDVFRYPRILFAIENSNDESYKLNFQDYNLIRNRGEGGIFGDPYLPLNTDGHNFIISAYGGSAWRWSEQDTYEYRDDEWYLIASENTYGYQSYVTNYNHDDYDRHIGIRRHNNSNFDSIEERDMERKGFDLTYEISLGEAPTLGEYSAKWFLAKDRLQSLEVKEVNLANNLDLLKSRSDEVKELAKEIKVNDVSYTDSYYIAYTFTNQNKDEEYLAIYNRESKITNVIANSKRLDSDSRRKYDGIKIHKDRVYYTSNITKDMTSVDSDGKKHINNVILSYNIGSMNMDGTDNNILFSYENRINKSDSYPYIDIGFEIYHKKIVLFTYGEIEKTYYRMNCDGSEVETLGSIKN